MKSSLSRRNAYRDRMQSSQIDPTLTATVERQKSAHAAHVAAAYPMQVALRAILNDYDLPGMDALLYEAFNNELYALGRRFKGATADSMATILHDKYLSRGGDADILGLIAETIHSITVEPAIPILLLPVNGEPAAPKAGNLTWNAALRATGYDVWLYRTVDPPAEVSHDQPGLLYAYAGLLGLTNYSWYIVGRNAAGPGTKSATWTFTTVV